MNKGSQQKQNSVQIYVLLTLVAVILAFFVGFGLNISQDLFAQISGQKMIHTIQKEVKVFVPSGEQVFIRNISIPAVSAEDEGISGVITVIIKEGNGMILTNVGNILIKEDTEHSARTAALYSFDYVQRNINNYDVIYNIDIDAPAIEGASAGAAMTVATIAALKNLKINNAVAITGTINHDGTIGPAQGIIEKAQAIKNSDKRLFLVPQTQSEETTAETEEYCQFYGENEFCTTETKVKKINISEEVEITIKEVEKIQDALNYFIIA